MDPNNKDWFFDALAVLDRFVGAASLPRAAAASTLALCSYLTGAWTTIPMFTLGVTLLVCTVVKRFEQRSVG